MRLIGIFGGIASGKSSIAKLLGEHGAAVIDADKIAHDVLLQPEVEKAARQRWGESILDAQGHVRREKLAKIVFAPPPDGPRELNYLEELTHPKVAQLAWREVELLRERGTVPAVVLDVPLLVKAGWYDKCDTLVFVEAPAEVRLARAMARGWGREDFARREAAQESLDRKRELADVIIDNSGSPESARAQVAQVWHSLVGPPSAR